MVVTLKAVLVAILFTIGCADLMGFKEPHLRDAGDESGGSTVAGYNTNVGGVSATVSSAAGGTANGLSTGGVHSTGTAAGGTPNAGTSTSGNQTTAGGTYCTGGGTATSCSDTVTVWSWGQKGNEPVLADPNWVVDSVLGANEGNTAVHPPALTAATPVELTINCGAQAHTELSFYLAKLASAPTLDFLVDGALRYSITQNYTWDFKKYLFDVPQGTHTYTFRAQSTNDAAKSFAVDSIACKNNPPVAASNGTVDFDRGFIPPEIGGNWLIDNLNTYSDGSTTNDEASIHPPSLKANTPVEMTFDCGGQAHTELSLYLTKLASAPTLDLLVDGVLRYSTSASYTWDFEKYVFDVPQGVHTYSFRAQSVTDAATSFAIDFLQCKNTTPVVASNATVDFDQGFVPPETGGTWLVDNLNAYSDGSTTKDEASIHPPALIANAPLEMTFDCGGQTHTELSFYLTKLASAPTLDLLVDGVLRYSITQNYTWDFKKFLFDVPQGMHSYTFRAQSAADAATSFAIDFFQCRNITAVTASNATVDFDRGFIPPEIGGNWLVDNTVDTYSDGSTTTDEAAIHPPPLKANVAVDMTFDCGGQPHSQLSFYLAKLSQTPTLDLLMDGTVLQNLSGSGTWSFKQLTVTVPKTQHVYTFRAKSASDASTSFAVDFIYCAP